MLRNFRHIFEGFLILLAFLFFRLLPLDFASFLAGALARLIGPFLRVHNIADTNLQLAMPELSELQRRKILCDMWDNLGRVMGEYPHLTRHVMKQRITIKGREYLDEIIKSGQAAIIISGHFANWEIAPLATSICGLPTVVINREPNNPLVAWLTRRIRMNHIKALYNKGRKGAFQAIGALKDGNALALLVDQKMNDGSLMSFFGRDAMTATAAARLAIKYQVPIVAGRIVRSNGVHFQLVVESPQYYAVDANPMKVTESINILLEEWIREYPAQWFWVHRRWVKKSYQQPT